MRNPLRTYHFMEGIRGDVNGKNKEPYLDTEKIDLESALLEFFVVENYVKIPGIYVVGEQKIVNEKIIEPVGKQWILVNEGLHLSQRFEGFSPDETKSILEEESKHYKVRYFYLDIMDENGQLRFEF